MLTKRIAHLIILALLFTSCSGYKVMTIVDSNQNYTNYRMTGNYVSGGKALQPYGNIHIGADFYDGGGAKASYSGLIVSCLVPQGVRIKKDSSLTIIIDGSSIVLSQNELDYKVQVVEMAHQKYLLERAWFNVNNDIICAIGLAKNVQYSLRGDITLSGEFSHENIERFKSFCKEFVK